MPRPMQDMIRAWTNTIMNILVSTPAGVAWINRIHSISYFCEQLFMMNLSPKLSLKLFICHLQPFCKVKGEERYDDTKNYSNYQLHLSTCAMVHEVAKFMGEELH